MQNIFYFFPVIFIGMWVLITFIISKMGWSRLAAEYPFDGPFTGTRVGMISASINSANYKNAIILKYNNEGICLKTVLFFRLFHKPVFIPWKEIKEVKDKKMLIASFKELVIGHPVVAVIVLNERTYNEIKGVSNKIEK